MKLDEHRIRQIFVWSIVLKGIDAAAEVLGALALALVSHEQVVTLVRVLTGHELAEDPNDLVANALMHFAADFSIGTKTFFALYLGSHGLIKLAMVAGLLANRAWAYPFGLAVMGLFIVYQVYEYSLTHSLAMLALTIFDVLVIGLIWHEWRTMRLSGRVGQ